MQLLFTETERSTVLNETRQIQQLYSMKAEVLDGRLFDNGPLTMATVPGGHVINGERAERPKQVVQTSLFFCLLCHKKSARAGQGKAQTRSIHHESQNSVHFGFQIYVLTKTLCNSKVLN